MTSKQYGQELCDILNKKRINEQELYDKIFEILKADAESEEEIWDNACKMFCGDTDQQPLELLKSVFYKKSKLLVRIKSETFYYIDEVPTVSFLKLLLDLIQKIKSLDYDKNRIEGLITSVNRSDNSGILNVGIGDLDFYYTVTTENKDKIQGLLGRIDREFSHIGITRSGNYTLGHVIGEYCKGVLKQHRDLSSIYTEDDVSGDSDSDTESDDWKHNIRVATESEYKKYTGHVAQSPNAMCKYGNGCRRRSDGKEPDGSLHFVKFSHPLGFIPVDQRRPFTKYYGRGKKRNTTGKLGYNTRRRSTKRSRHTRRHHRR